MRWSVPGVWRPPAGFGAFAEELAPASAASGARQTRQRWECLAVKYGLSYLADLVPALKVKYGLKLIGEQLPSGWLEGPDWYCAAMAYGPGARRQAGEGRP